MEMGVLVSGIFGGSLSASNLLSRIVAIIVLFCGALLFLFVPETFWDRKPVPRKARRSQRPSIFRRYSSKYSVPQVAGTVPQLPTPCPDDIMAKEVNETQNRNKAARVGFAPDPDRGQENEPRISSSVPEANITHQDEPVLGLEGQPKTQGPLESEAPLPSSLQGDDETPAWPSPPAAVSEPRPSSAMQKTQSSQPAKVSGADYKDTDSESQSVSSARLASQQAYTVALRSLPARTFFQQLRPFHGRLNNDKWHKVALRPLILFAYPAVLWSAVVYSCSVGWLIVISESVAVIYREGHPYHFDALGAGLLYISPFVGGILGTAVAGQVSDIIVKAMARRNGGLYEPEFRLVMAVPVALTTVIGLVGFGWSAQADNHFMVPTVFFGMVSFGCSLGSTTSITFCVDSYRQYAGEALVTLNFSKNIFHGLVFSLFVTGWITSDGPKTVYIWIGIIQLTLLLFTIPMYIYGKRARMWTVRKNFMERF